MKTVLVTGGAGLIGAECCKLFSEKGWRVLSVDNFFRGMLFGKNADTKKNVDSFFSEYGVKNFEMDFRSEKIITLLKESDAVIHTAAQPSHPKSIEVPAIDFEENALGTFQLLEYMRSLDLKIPFVFCSTNKVYGDKPNEFEYCCKGKRFEPVDESIWNGFGESLSVDQCKHTPFGASKLSADVYVQEYSKLYGLNAGIFRLGCITGTTACATELQNWLPFFIKKALSGEKLTIFGYKGFQVRDLLHARDLAELFYSFVKKPVSGLVFNVGGGRNNSISLLEAIDLLSEKGLNLKYSFGSKRQADHKWWITNTKKTRRYFGWKPKTELEQIFNELIGSLSK